MINRNFHRIDPKNDFCSFQNAQSHYSHNSIVGEIKNRDRVNKYVNFSSNPNSGNTTSKEQMSVNRTASREIITQANVNQLQSNKKMGTPQQKDGQNTSENFDESIDQDFKNVDLKKFKISDFDLGMKLGKGKFGSVYLAREKKSNYVVALKILNKMEIQRLNSEKLIIREIKIHSYVDHPNIIKLYGFFHDDQNIYLILEYATDGEVYQELKSAVT